MKVKTKQPARMTKMRPEDMEFQMAMKDFENMVLEQGYLEISRGNAGKKLNYDWLGVHMKVCKEHGHVVLKWQCCQKNQGPMSKYWTGYFKEEDFKIFLNSNGLTRGILLHTEFNCDELKCYGHPISGQQEWVEANLNGRNVLVQCLIFCEIYEELYNPIKTELYHVQKPGTYAIVHFLEYNIFGKFDREFKLYGHHQKKIPRMKTVF